MQNNLIYGKNAVESLLTGESDVDTVYLFSEMDARMASYFKALAKQKGAVVKTVPRQKLSTLTGCDNHQGVAAFTATVTYHSLSDLETFAEQKDAAFLLLDDICDPHNIGALMRSAYLFGFTAILIPKRGGAAVTPVVSKASAGASQKIPVVRVANIGEAVRRLKDLGVFVFAADMKGAPYEQTNLTGKVALVMGSEQSGVSPLVKKLCDGLVSIPHRADDSIDSLNVSVAGSILMNHMKRI